MIYLENKIEIFKKIIYNEERDRLNNRLSDLSTKQKEEFAKKEELIKKGTQQIIQRKKVKGKNKYDEMVMTQQQKNQEAVSVAKASMVEIISKRLLDMFKKYRKSDEYAPSIQAEILEAIKSLKNDHVILKLVKEDMQNFDPFLKNLENQVSKKITLEEMDDSQVGGFVLMDIGKRVSINESFKNKIDSKKYEIGTKLSELLEEGERIV